MKKIVTIVGARPQFVKAAVLSRIIRQHNQIEEVIVHTGQHFDVNMSAVFFEEMQIPTPDYNLQIHSKSHGEMTGEMLGAIEKVLLKEQPDAVVVYGDTNSTLAGALAAKKLHIKVVHIEAGLRSFAMEMPEEINRILTDRISDVLLCPTTTAVQNLKNEGFDHFDSQVILTGDIMKDSVTFYSPLAKEKSTCMEDLGLTGKPFVLATLHRQENTDSVSRLQALFKGLDSIHKTMPVVMPLHPRTQKQMKELGIQTSITCIDPVGYFDMLCLLQECSMVLTDSGGLQKEAYFSKKPCIVLRDETEWVELVSEGFATLVGADDTALMNAFEEYQHQKPKYDKHLYGEDVGAQIYTAIYQLIE